MRQRKWNRRNALLGLIALTLLLLGAAGLGVGAELFHRYRETHKLSMSVPVDTWVRDPDLLYRLNPRSPKFHDSYRGKAPGSTPDAEVHVVCMGGSTTYGHDVDVTESWPYVVEHELRADGVLAEVVNAGTPGWGSRQVRRRYERDVATHDPDFVVLYVGWNRTGALVSPEGWVPSGIPRPEQSRIGRMWTIVRHAFVRRSLLLRDFTYAMKIRRQVAESDEWSPDAFHDVFAADLRALVTEIQQHGQTAVLVIQMSFFHDDMTPEEIALYEPHIWSKKTFRPAMLAELAEKHDTVRAVAEELGTPLIDAQASIRELRGEPRLELFIDQMHMTALGHRHLGKVVAAELEDLIRERQRVGGNQKEIHAGDPVGAASHALAR